MPTRFHNSVRPTVRSSTADEERKKDSKPKQGYCALFQLLIEYHIKELSLCFLNEHRSIINVLDSYSKAVV